MGKHNGRQRDPARPRGDWLAFDRADYLGTKIILGISMVGSVLFGLAGPVVAARHERAALAIGLGGMVVQFAQASPTT